MVSAEAHFRVGDTEAAIKLEQEAVDAGRKLGDQLVMMRTLANLAAYLLASDRYDEARTSAREALDFSRLAHGATTVIWALQHLAMVAALRSQRQDGRPEDLARAARLLSFTHTRIAELGGQGDFSEQEERKRLKSVLKKALPQSEFDRWYFAGTTMTETQAIDEAMAI
jgi:tetratricopeptide (TPR) repeat protein